MTDAQPTQMEQRMAEMQEIAERLYPILRDFPPDGQLRSDEQRASLTDLILTGFVERMEVKKPCKCCGKPQFDYGYFRITGGGKLFVAAMERQGVHG